MYIQKQNLNKDDDDKTQPCRSENEPRKIVVNLNTQKNKYLKLHACVSKKKYIVIVIMYEL